jgi:hypothetical protein
VQVPSRWSLGKSPSPSDQEPDELCLETFLRMRGIEREVGHNHDVRLDFTEQDLNAIRREALEQLSDSTELAGERLSPEQIQRVVRGDPYAYVPGVAVEPTVNSIAAAKDPYDVLTAIHNKAGLSGSTGALDFLIRFQLDPRGAKLHGQPTALARPNRRLPGRLSLLARADD